MNEPAVVLRTEHLAKSYMQGGATLHVFEDATLTIKVGEIVAIIGQSGCGKTTFLQLAGLLDKAGGGKIYIGGRDCTKLSDRKRTRMRRDNIGFVYQFHHLMPEFTALENVMLPQMLAGVKKRKAREKALALLQQLGMEPRAKHRPAELSGGEQQRVAIARALANNPAILLADEPTGNLDPATAESVFALLLARVKQSGAAMLFVTHDRKLAAQADRVMTFKEGRLVSRTDL